MVLLPREAGGGDVDLKPLTPSAACCCSPCSRAQRTKLLGAAGWRIANIENLGPKRS
jgi:hypothetical protein